MRIGIDTRWAEYEAGVYRVIVHLFCELISLPEARDHEFVLFGVDIFESTGQVRPGNVRVVSITRWKRKLFQGLWKTVGWPPLDWLTGKLDVVHFTNFVAVPMNSCPHRGTRQVVTIHDMAWKRYPETIEAKNLRFLEKFCEQSITHADAVHCVSEFTAREVEYFLESRVWDDKSDALDEKVFVVPNALSGNFKVLDRGDRIAAESNNGVVTDWEWDQRKRLSLPDKYVLFVGTLEPRKNLQFLISEMQALWRTGDFDDVSVVIVGVKGWNEDVQSALDPEFSDRVIFPGYVSDDDLVVVYNLAEVFVFPSLYEGFGIPILEAMACGTPVVCSDIPASYEVGEGACEYFALEDGSLEDVLGNVLSDDDLQKHMIARGYVQVQKYSWRESARKLLALYERL